MTLRSIPHVWWMSSSNARMCLTLKLMMMMPIRSGPSETLWISYKKVKLRQSMKRTTKCLLYLQYLMGRLFVVIVGPLLFIAVRLMGYRVRELSEMRKTARDLFKQHKGPWVICPNHMTMIDSVIVAYAMAPLYRYILWYRLLPWNLPEQTNFSEQHISDHYLLFVQKM